MADSKLSAQRVNEIFLDCLFRGDETTPGNGFVEAVRLKVGFHLARLEAHKAETMELLLQLPDEFRKSSGGGWSFLNACITKQGNQWGEHSDVDKLLALGIATDQAQIQIAREFWPVVPGGLPYFVVQ